MNMRKSDGGSHEQMSIQAVHALLDAYFWVGNPERVRKRLPYPRVHKPIVREVESTEGNLTYIAYERPPKGRCLLGHRMDIVVADYWNVLTTLARRLECSCGAKSRIEVY